MKNRKPRPWLAVLVLFALQLGGTSVAWFGADQESAAVALVRTLPGLVWLVVWLPFPVVLLARRRWMPAFACVACLPVVLWGPMGLRWSAPAASGPTGLRLMTFNVQEMVAGPEAVAAAIRGEDPDVVCLQEADIYNLPGKLPRALAEALPDYAWAIDGQLMVGSRLPVVSHRTYDLPFEMPQRPLQEVVVEFDGSEVAVWNTHLYPTRFDLLLSAPLGLPEGTREATARRLAQVREFESALLQSEGRRVVLAGDFNNGPYGAVPRWLRELGFRDTFDLGGRGFGHSLPTGRPVLRIDQVWVRADSLRVPSHRVSPARASDHRAVVVEVGF